MTERYKVYDGGGSGNGYKVWLFLNLLGIEYDYVELDIPSGAAGTPEFKAINPVGKIPVLDCPDGRRLIESNAILNYLAMEHGPGWIPEDPFQHAQMLSWMFWEQYSHEPNIAVLRYWHHFIEMTDDHRAQEAEKKAQGIAALEIMNMQLSYTEWLVGNGPTLADLALYAYTHVAHEGGFDLAPYNGIKAWLKRIEALEGYQPIDFRPLNAEHFVIP